MPKLDCWQLARAQLPAQYHVQVLVLGLYVMLPMVMLQDVKFSATVMRRAFEHLQ